MNKGLVLKQIGGKFTVKSEDKQIFNIFARGNLRNNGILVGDIVDFEKNIITKVYPRKNQLLRPPIANIEQLILVIAQIPKTDFLLLDKMIMFADKNDIDVIICINKKDILEESLYNQIQNQYRNIVKNIVLTDAINGDIDDLTRSLKDKITVFAGQSAVGKSTLLNCIIGKNIAEIGEISKIGYGKNTTRKTEIYEIEQNSFIADTPGFSSLELINFSPEEISAGYKEFYLLSKNCKYRQCDHIFISDCECEVLRQLKDGNISTERYERYKELYVKTKEIWRNRYGN